MRLYSGRIPAITEQIVEVLTHDASVEVEDEQEVRLDIEAVLKEYLRLDKEIMDEAKSRMEARGLGYGQLSKTRSQVARERRAPQAEDSLPYILDQILHVLFHSKNVAEIFIDDVEIRKRLTPILRKNMEVEGELDQEVRSKIKNLEEGTASFEIEYARVMGHMKQKKGLA